MFHQFKLSVDPMRSAGKLAMILVQFPPWFDCKRENVDQIRNIRRQLEGYDVAIEFRHQSWYAQTMQEGTVSFLKELNFIHTVCDEPQAGEGSVPLIAVSTRNDKVFVRLHGRNVNGGATRPETMKRGARCGISTIIQTVNWTKSGKSSINWRMSPKTFLSFSIIILVAMQPRTPSALKNDGH